MKETAGCFKQSDGYVFIMEKPKKQGQVDKRRRRMTEYGYIRVSSKDQNTDRQYRAMIEAGLKPENLFTDKESGKDFNRTNYKKMVKKLKAGDVFFVKAIDRLGRNYDEIIVQWSYLTRKKEVDIVVLDCPILDTRVKVNGLTGKVITDIFLQLMSYVAQIERDNIKQRQLEGIRSAKLKGVQFGRPPTKIPDNYEEVYHQWCKRIISGREAARRLDVNHNTFTKWAKKTEPTNKNS